MFNCSKRIYLSIPLIIILFIIAGLYIYNINIKRENAVETLSSNNSNQSYEEIACMKIEDIFTKMGYEYEKYLLPENSLNAENKSLIKVIGYNIFADKDERLHIAVYNTPDDAKKEAYEFFITGFMNVETHHFLYSNITCVYTGTNQTIVSGIKNILGERLEDVQFTKEKATELGYIVLNDINIDISTCLLDFFDHNNRTKNQIIKLLTFEEDQSISFVYIEKKSNGEIEFAKGNKIRKENIFESYNDLYTKSNNGKTHFYLQKGNDKVYEVVSF